jgi:hypothetical protein
VNAKRIRWKNKLLLEYFFGFINEMSLQNPSDLARRTNGEGEVKARKTNAARASHPSRIVSWISLSCLPAA